MSGAEVAVRDAQRTCAALRLAVADSAGALRAVGVRRGTPSLTGVGGGGGAATPAAGRWAAEQIPRTVAVQLTPPQRRLPRPRQWAEAGLRPGDRHAGGLVPAERKVSAVGSRTRDQLESAGVADQAVGSRAAVRDAGGQRVAGSLDAGDLVQDTRVARLAGFLRAVGRPCLGWCWTRLSGRRCRWLRHLCGWLRHLRGWLRHIRGWLRHIRG